MADSADEERIRRWPVRLARAFNLVVGWTDDYCYGGCGRPVTGRLYRQIEVTSEGRIVASLCSLGTACDAKVEEDPRDEHGNSYADIRPVIIEQLRLLDPADKPVTVRLAFGR